jgi:hypothetical protein
MNAKSAYFYNLRCAFCHPYLDLTAVSNVEFFKRPSKNTYRAVALDVIG